MEEMIIDCYDDAQLIITVTSSIFILLGTHTPLYTPANITYTSLPIVTALPTVTPQVDLTTYWRGGIVELVP